jgi:hypothetical protein
MWDDAALRAEEVEDDSDEMEAENPRACERLSAAVYEVRFGAIVGLGTRVRVWFKVSSASCGCVGCGQTSKHNGAAL